MPVRKSHEFVKAFRFRVFIDEHRFDASASEVVLRNRKPNLITIEAPLEVSITQGFRGASMRCVKSKLARWFDGEPHHVCIEQLDRDEIVLSRWACKQAQPVELAACRLNVYESAETQEIITFECGHIATGTLPEFDANTDAKRRADAK